MFLKAIEWFASDKKVGDELTPENEATAKEILKIDFFGGLVMKKEDG